MRRKTPSLARSKFDSALLRPLVPSRSGLLKSVFQYAIISFEAFEPKRSRCGIGEGSAICSGDAGLANDHHESARVRPVAIIGRESHRYRTPPVFAPTICAESTPALSITWVTNVARFASANNQSRGER